MHNKTNQSKANDMTNPAIRDSVFKSVFNTDSGKLVLDYLTELYEIKSPDTLNSNSVYFDLGKQAVIRHIKTIIKRK